MKDLEEKLNSLFKLLEYTAGPLCMSLVSKKVKLSQLKEIRSNLIESLVVLDSILEKLDK